MTEKKDKKPIFPDPLFHEEAVLISSVFQQPGWIKWLERISRKKESLALKMSRNETDIEVAAVEKKAKGITIVVLNKDVNKLAYDLLVSLENEFKELQIEAARKPEEENERSSDPDE